MVKTKIYQVFNGGDCNAVCLNIEDSLYLKGYVDNWITPVFQIKDGEFMDYQNNVKALRLCSKELRHLFESMKSADDEIQWLDAVVRLGKEERQYSVLHFPTPADVVDREKSKCSKRDGSIICPALSAVACQKHNIFSVSRRLSFYISSKVKAAIEAKGLTGMDIEKTLVAE